MSTDTTDRMRRYESNQDNGDTNTPEPAISPAPDTDTGAGNDQASDPIPMAVPQSPVQTESDTAQTEDSPEAGDDNSTEVRSNRGSDKEYREV